MVLQLDPLYDVAFPCPKCSFVARGPGALEDHMNEHGIMPGLVAAVPVNAESAIPVKVPKVFTCSACGEVITGYGEFMQHKRREARAKRAQMTEE